MTGKLYTFYLPPRSRLAQLVAKITSVEQIEVDISKVSLTLTSEDEIMFLRVCNRPAGSMQSIQSNKCPPLMITKCTRQSQENLSKIWCTITTLILQMSTGTLWIPGSGQMGGLVQPATPQLGEGNGPGSQLQMAFPFRDNYSLVICLIGAKCRQNE